MNTTHSSGNTPKPIPIDVRSIALDLILTVVTCGLYNLYVQYAQMRSLNRILGVAKYSFGMWGVLCLLTCGLYHIYHEYRMSKDIYEAIPGVESYLPVLSALACVLGGHIIVDAVQQFYINRYFGSESI